MAITKIPAAGFSDAVNFRNIIINGDMSIAQRGTSTSSVTTSGYYACDRWDTNFSSLGTWTISQDTDVPSGQGFGYSMKWDCTTADASPSASDNCIIQQHIEGQMLQQLKKGTSNAESVTMSFWVKSNKTGTYTVQLRDTDNSRHICKEFTISSSATWEKKTLTFAGDTTGAFDNDNAKSLQLDIYLGAGSNFTSGTLASSWASYTQANTCPNNVNLADSTSNYINITGVQLEVGSAASDFEFLPVDVNLQRCQRYFVQYGRDLNGAVDANVGIGQWYSTSEVVYNIYSPVRMRAKPTLTSPTVSGGYRFHLAGSYTDVDTGGGITNCDNQALSVYKSGLGGGTGGQATFVAFIVNGAKLQFSAEL